MKVDNQTWLTAMTNLMNRRKTRGETNDNARLDNVIADYKSHLSKVHVGKTVLDVGAGSQYLKECLPEGVQYFGLDPFPLDESVFRGKIEDNAMLHIFTNILYIETVCAFAVMDSLIDFDKAIANIKQIAQKNVVFLTGLNIPCDSLHTFELKIDDFIWPFMNWNETLIEEIAPKVWLLEFTKP